MNKKTDTSCLWGISFFVRKCFYKMFSLEAIVVYNSE